MKTSFKHFSLLLFVILLGLLTSCESRKIIVNGLDEKEANEILVFLSSKGIDAIKVEATAEKGAGTKVTLWNISVEASRANEAMALLNQVGLPRRRGQSLLNIFSSGALVPSGLQEKIRYQAGLGEQIANVIRKIDGVLDAEVQISFPEEDPLNPGALKQKITASVFVRHSGVLDDPNAHLVTRIKRLVAGSVPGLDFDNVTVIGDRPSFTVPPLGGFGAALGQEERPYVNVWSVIIAKDSVTRFQLLFFSFTIAIVILLLVVIWLLWKFLPLLQQLGGFKQLLSFHSLSTAEIKKEKEELPSQEEAVIPSEEDSDQGIT